MQLDQFVNRIVTAAFIEGRYSRRRAVKFALLHSGGREINAASADGKMHVSCYTCHRGEAEPKTAPEPKLGE
jgi:hypothetical protein